MQKSSITDEQDKAHNMMWLPGGGQVVFERGGPTVAFSSTKEDKWSTQMNAGNISVLPSIGIMQTRRLPFTYVYII